MNPESSRPTDEVPAEPAAPPRPAGDLSGGEPARRFISPLTVKRLSLYLRYLEELAAQRRVGVSSRQLGEALGLTAAQVRKDLAYFGQFGRPGVGYPVASLVERLRSIFGTDKIWNVALLGVGSLGRALLRHRGFVQKGFRLVAAFDVAASKVGRRFGEVTIQALDDLPAAVRARGIRLAIVAVPPEAAQAVADLACRAGIKGLLNFAPVTLSAPPEVAVVPVDLAVQLEQLSYLVNAPGNQKRK